MSEDPRVQPMGGGQIQVEQPDFSDSSDAPEVTDAINTDTEGETNDNSDDNSSDDASRSDAEKEGTEDASDGKEVDDDLVELDAEAFGEAEAGTLFTDGEHTYKKVDGCEVAVPVIDEKDEMYKFLKTSGFDQNEINEEFWVNKGELSDDTLNSLRNVYGPGPVDSFVNAQKQAHMAYLDKLNDGEVAAKNEAAKVRAAVEARDNETYGMVSEVFGQDDGKTYWHDEVIPYLNENVSVDRRRDIANALNTGGEWARRTLMKSIEREMRMERGEVHKLINLNDSPADNNEAANGSKANLQGAITQAQFEEILSDPSQRYWKDDDYNKRVQEAYLRGQRRNRK